VNRVFPPIVRSISSFTRYVSFLERDSFKFDKVVPVFREGREK
jgi:hypothetical protein